MHDEAVDAAAASLARLAPRLGRLIAGALETDPRLSLSLRQYRMLERVAEEPQRITQLAMTSGITQPTASASVGRLVERGLMTRISDPRDGRANLVTLTAKGKRVLALAERRVHEQLVLITREITQRDVEALAELEPKLIAGLDRLRAERGAGAEPTSGLILEVAEDQ